MDQKTEDARTFLIDLMQTSTEAKHDYDSIRVGMLRAEDEARHQEHHKRTMRTVKVMAVAFLLAAASTAAVVAI